MTAQTSPRPNSLQRAELEPGDLDARILQAEQRLIHRDENVRRRASALGRRAKEVLQPRRLLGPALGVAAAGLGLAWLWRGRAAAARPRGDFLGREAGAEADGRARQGEVPWVRLVGFVWPLLPAAWRARVSPNTVNMVMALGLPLAETLFTRAPPPPMRTAGPLTSAQLAGTWHEVARLPGGSGAALQLQFTPRGDGTIDIVETRIGADGKELRWEGTARAEPGSGGARLHIERRPAGLRWLPQASRDEWVLHIDPDASELVLGSPRRDSLRLLSRRRRLPPARLHVMVETARDQGFAVDKLRFVDGL